MTDDSFVAFDTSLGTFVVELYNQAAPITVANFLSYVQNPAPGANYDGSFFHRLVAGFVLQGGGYDIQNHQIATIPTSAPIANEYSAANPDVAGTIAMALTGGDANSATDEFFFNLGDNSTTLGTSANGPFTVFGRVVENYSVVQAIAALPTFDLGGAAFSALPVQGTVGSSGPTVSNLVQITVATVAPVAGGQAGQQVLDDGVIAPFASVTLTDPGNATGAGDTVTISLLDATGAPAAASGTLSLPVGSGGTLAPGATAGTYVLSGLASLAALQAALGSLVFTPATLGSQGAGLSVALDLALQTPGGTIDNGDTSLSISHDFGSAATVAGADGVTRTLSFAASGQTALAVTLLAGVVPASALYADASGAYGMAAGQTAAIDDAAGPVTVAGNGAAQETIAAGAGAFAFQGGSGSGTIITGAGADSIYLPGGGDFAVLLGAGADTVVAATGNNTVSTGAAGSILFLGSGTTSVASAGADTVVGAGGTATIAATGGAADEVFALGGTLQFIAGHGASTVVAGTAGATVAGGPGNTLMFGDGPTNYVGAGGTDTVVGLAGSLTVVGGAGGGLFFGGTAGGNVITAGSGNTTAVAAGAGDVLTATGNASDLFAGGVGAETLTGAGSSGDNTFFAGFGPETLVGGAGTTALVAGAANDLLAGGSGLTLFLFVNGRTAGGSDTITGFDPSHDFVRLAGYAGTGAQAAQAASVTNGSATVALSDGTQITFSGVTTLAATSFT